jgi:hypothetical protein
LRSEWGLELVKGGVLIKWFSGQLKRKGEMSIQNETFSREQGAWSVEPEGSKEPRDGGGGAKGPKDKETKGAKDDPIAMLGY